MKRGDYQYKFYNHIACIKWYDNKSVVLLGSHMEEITSISTVQRRLRGSSPKVSVNFPNGIQKQYRWSWLDGSAVVSIPTWSKIEVLILSPFVFYLFHGALVNSFVVHKTLGNKNLTLKEFKICIALKLIASFVCRKLSWLNHRPSKCTKAQRSDPIPLIFLETRRRCTVFSQAGKKNRTFAMCSLCVVALCLQKERNCFLQYHS